MLVFCAGMLVGITGCSRNIESGGTVKYSDGDPVPCGIIFFSDAKNSYESVIDNGVFQLGGLKPGKGIPAGTYKVHIMGTLPAEGTAPGEPVVAEKFVSSETSGITCVVKKGENTPFEIVVERPK